MEIEERLSHYVEENNNGGDCQLCTQFIEQSHPNLFDRIFGEGFNPILCETDNFVWVVGLGQIIEGYTLLITKAHVFSIGEVINAVFEEYLELKDRIVKKYQSVYHVKPLIFEHGSIDQCNKAGGCVDHAHLHFFPINVDLFEDLRNMTFKFEKVKSILATHKSAKDNDPYFYIENTSADEKYLFYKVYNVRSQLLRALLSNRIRDANHWNWRKYIGREEMLRTVKKLGNIPLYDFRGGQDSIQ